VTGNPVEVIETSRAETTEKLAGRQSVWRDIANDGTVVYGATLDELRGAVRA
jgi:hypothetical protein